MARNHKMGADRRREHREALAAAFGNHCQHCQRSFTDVLPPTLDHIHPWALGGANRRINLQLLCQPCNWARSLWIREQTPTDPDWQPAKIVTRKQRAEHARRNNPRLSLA